jgi:hypothetical protein
MQDFLRHIRSSHPTGEEAKEGAPILDEYWANF